MHKEYDELMMKLRKFIFTLGIRSFSMDEICKKIFVPKSLMTKHIKNKSDLVEQLLTFERIQFQSIFNDYDFEDLNAIKVLIIVNKEVALRFNDVSPSMAFDLQKFYPEHFSVHYKKEQEFISEKIELNLHKGIEQGMYREDINVDLIVHHYFPRLIELQDPTMIKTEKFSFGVLSEFIIDLMIRGIATREGIEYYEKEINYK
jgi:AcrR family transcriptional regulator